MFAAQREPHALGRHRLWAIPLTLALIVAATVFLLASMADLRSSASPAAAPIAVGPLGARTLVSVQTVSRHGSRAPNAIAGVACPLLLPALRWFGSLNISAGGLTATGMRELRRLGRLLRAAYIERNKFLPPFFDDAAVYVRAVGEDRTLQSAAAMGHGLFPPGTAPRGYPAAAAAARARIHAAGQNRCAARAEEGEV